MILRKPEFPDSGGIFIHNSLWFNSSISSEALRVYGVFLSLPEGKIYPGKDICNPLGISMATFNRVKKELKNIDLLATECKRGGVWLTYIGNPEYPASKVKEDHKSVLVYE